jgi:hypothetical protein
MFEFRSLEQQNPNIVRTDYTTDTHGFTCGMPLAWRRMCQSEVELNTTSTKGLIDMRQMSESEEDRVDPSRSSRSVNAVPILGGLFAMRLPLAVLSSHAHRTRPSMLHALMSLIRASRQPNSRTFTVHFNHLRSCFSSVCATRQYLTASRNGHNRRFIALRVMLVQLLSRLGRARK